MKKYIQPLTIEAQLRAAASMLLASSPATNPSNIQTIYSGNSDDFEII